MTRPYPITDVNCSRGAPMGRVSDLPSDGPPIRLHLRYVPFVDGCYDQGGAYWGAPANLYVAWGDDPDSGFVVEFYTRAYNREHAKEIVRKHRPNATFYR